MGLTKCDLTASKRKLLELMQHINFGRIDGLTIENSEPVFDPPPRVVREIKLGGVYSPRPEIESDNFTLKSKAVEFLSHLEHLCNGTVETIEIKHGLPFHMRIEEPIRV